MAASAGAAPAGWPAPAPGDAVPVAGEPDPVDEPDAEGVDVDGELGVPPDDGAEVPSGLDGEEGVEGDPGLLRPPGLAAPGCCALGAFWGGAAEYVGFWLVASSYGRG